MNAGSGHLAHGGHAGQGFCLGHVLESGHLGQTGGTISLFKIYLLGSGLKLLLFALLLFALLLLLIILLLFVFLDVL